jgi:hypothetical protein
MDKTRLRYGPFKVIVALLRSVFINNSDQGSKTEVCLEEGEELSK